jgi:hypothetical protein
MGSTRQISDQDISNYIHQLGNQLHQKRVAKEIIDDVDLLGDNIELDSCFIFEKHHLLQTLMILRTSPAMDVLRALVIILSMIVKTESALRTGRVEALYSSGIVDQIVEISIPLLVAKKAKGYDLALGCLRFYSFLVSAGLSSARKFMGSGNSPIVTALHDIISMSDDPSFEFVTLSLTCLRTLSAHPSLCIYLITECELYINVLQNTFEGEFQDKPDFICDTRVAIMEILYNITEKSPETLEQMFSLELINILKNILKNNLNSAEVISALRLLGLCISKGATHAKQLEPLLPIVYSIAQDSHSSLALRNASLKCFRKATTHLSAKSVQPFLQDLNWLLLLCKDSNNNETRKESMGVLHNVTIIDSSLPTKKFGSQILLFVNEIINPIHNHAPNEDQIYYALGIMCNLAFNDKASQKICSIGHPALFKTLVGYATHEKDSIRRLSLECIRNLCIDKPSCIEIMELALPVLFKNLSTCEHITQTIQIIRNIWFQQRDCFLEIFHRPEFIDTLLFVLRKGDVDAQKASLDILEKFAATENPHYISLLLQHGAIWSLQRLLHCGLKDRAVLVLEKLNVVGQTMKPKEDPWECISLGWSQKDRILGRETKKKRKKHQSIRKSKAS